MSAKAVGKRGRVQGILEAEPRGVSGVFVQPNETGREDAQTTPTRPPLIEVEKTEGGFGRTY